MPDNFTNNSESDTLDINLMEDEEMLARYHF